MDEGTTILGLVSALGNREFSAVELVDRYLQRIDRLNPTLNCFGETYPDRARTKAQQLDQRIEAGEEIGPLAGVPICEGQHRYRLREHEMRVSVSGEFPKSIYKHRCAALGGSGRDHHRQNELRRVRNGFINGTLRIRRGAQSVGSGAGTRRIIRG